jgi:ResB-like family protein
MSLRGLLDRVYDGLASLRLAVVVMSSLGLTCLLATLYESKHGTAAVQREVYRTWWFAGILTFLGLNIFCAMMKRYPWKAHHTGFVMAHIGILTLLLGSLVSLHFGMDGNMALFEGETTDRVALLDRSLQVMVSGQDPGVFPVSFEKRPPAPGREQRFTVPGGVTAVAEDYLPHVEIKEEYAAASDGPAALHFLLDNPFAKQDAWLATGDPSTARISFGPAAVSLRTLGSEGELRSAAPTGEGNEIAFLLAPSGALGYAIGTRNGPGPRGLVTPGQPIETPWMGMKVVVQQFLPHAERHRTAVAAPPPARDERQQPAVKVHLEGPAGRSPSQWIPWTEIRSIPYAGGTARVAYRAPEVSVPFHVSLLKFNSDKYPGSSMAATYESWVRVDDAERGVTEHHISMNHPLHYRGYIFFQASFVEGEPMMSIFSVARSPGLPLVYAGTTLIAAGVVWMFYVKPYLARRRAAQALRAHRERESRHEAPSPVPVPSRAGPAQAAPGGA